MKFTNHSEEVKFVDAITVADDERPNTTSNVSQSGRQIMDEVEAETWNEVEAEPLDFHDAEEESDGEMDVSIWVHQNLIKLSKEFEVIYNGRQKDASALFMKKKQQEAHRNQGTNITNGRTYQNQGRARTQGAGH